MVYPKLGLGDSHDKNKYMPELVKSRILWFDSADVNL